MSSFELRWFGSAPFLRIFIESIIIIENYHKLPSPVQFSTSFGGPLRACFVRPYKSGRPGPDIAIFFGCDGRGEKMKLAVISNVRSKRRPIDGIVQWSIQRGKSVDTGEQEDPLSLREFAESGTRPYNREIRRSALMYRSPTECLDEKDKIPGEKRKAAPEQELKRNSFPSLEKKGCTQ